MWDITAEVIGIHNILSDARYHFKLLPGVAAAAAPPCRCRLITSASQRRPSPQILVEYGSSVIQQKSGSTF
jgi:hypothetical protein